ncbi:MAG: hypothetical protein Q7U02_09195 [Desulfosalsimonadaceae bacterium]|nr:hypothetical protein [Desulfosalsimonadaceae bacterium]
MKTIMHISLMLILAVLPCFATEKPDVPPPEPSPVHEHGREWFVLGGAKYDSITGPTASACLCWQIYHPGRIMCSHDFWIFQAEAGRGGGKLQFGVGVMYWTGGAAKLSLLHTWGDPMEVETNQTYFGAECQLNFFLLNGTLGLYRKIHGDDEDETLATWSTGIGF